ncbi:MAG: response regulator [Gemmatimonadota bacterium]
MTLRIVVADDHSVVLHGLQAILALEPDMEVVAVCTDGIEAMEAVELHRPDVVIMDARMPKCDGLEAYDRLGDRGLKTPTVILTATLNDATLLRCVESGVEAIVLKEAVAGGIVDAVRAVARGERWIPPELSARAVEFMGRRKSEDVLTPREREIARLAAAGKSNKRIATELSISQSTVKLHLHSAFTKLGVSNRVQLSLLAREQGWI